MVESKQLINGQYKVEKKLGSGSFGEIYLGIDKKTNDIVAIKFVILYRTHYEFIQISNNQIKQLNQKNLPFYKQEKKESKCPQLEYEYKLLKYLSNNSNGITEVQSFTRNTNHNIMVMECLDKSLEDLFESCG